MKRESEIKIETFREKSGQLEKLSPKRPKLEAENKLPEAQHIAKVVLIIEH
jgi:hypothetical protein